MRGGGRLEVGSGRSKSLAKSRVMEGSSHLPAFHISYFPVQVLKCQVNLEYLPPLGGVFVKQGQTESPLVGFAPALGV